jgi:hypothetical protein
VSDASNRNQGKTTKHGSLLWCREGSTLAARAGYGFADFSGKAADFGDGDIFCAKLAKLGRRHAEARLERAVEGPIEPYPESRRSSAPADAARRVAEAARYVRPSDSRAGNR